MRKQISKRRRAFFFLVFLVLCLSIYSPLYYSPLIKSASAWDQVNSPDGIWQKEWTFSRIRVDSNSPTNIYNVQNETIYLHGGAQAQLSYSLGFSSSVIRTFADLGATFFRIPIGRYGGDGDRWYNASALNSLDNAVDTANDYEVYVMIDMHSYPDNAPNGLVYSQEDLIDDNVMGSGSGAGKKARLQFYEDWVFMAQRYDGNISVAVLEATNEPYFTLGGRSAVQVMQNWTIVLNELKWHLDQNCSTDYILASPATPNYKCGGGVALVTAIGGLIPQTA